MKKDPNSPTRVLITAGPTIEPLDPVRFISNHSTGIMGYETAKEAVKRGYDTCLISGPVSLSPPEGARVIKVETACEMRDSVMENIDDCDCLIMTAAVCDFRPQERKDQKIKKREKLTLELVKNPDILAEVSGKKDLVKMGFALETEENALENAKEKLRTKSLDFIVANVKKENTDPFGPGEKDFTVIDNKGKTREFKKISKCELAKVLLDEMEGLLQ